MNHFSARLFVVLLASSLAASQGRADYMNWSYSSSATPPGFAATGADNSSGAVQLTPFSHAAAASSIATLAYQTSASGAVSFNGQNDTFTLKMTFTDLTTHDSGSLSFVGSISGNLAPTSSSVVEKFAVTQQSLTLDGHVYTVTLPASTALAAPTSPQQDIMAKVSVTNAGGGGGTTQGTPEPTSLILGGLGTCLAGLGGWWKRRRQRQPQAA